ncbi:hypothetical protein EXD76_02485 [BEV proteobacterium]|nr:hypothetical protein [Candidatus Symbiopectobacterium sp. Chty_BC]
MIQQSRTWVDVEADTVCLHGDGDHALLFARKLRQFFNEHQIQVRAA